MGPLAGLRIVELAGIGPGPMAAMMLGDMGADVVRVDRTRATARDLLPDPRYSVHGRSRRSVAIDLQQREGAEVVLRLAEKADGLIEPFRPGVAERLGVGPEPCLVRNPKLVYGRMTGWGQDGPFAKAAGHDINYIALTGLLHAIGRAGDAPVPPLNLVGDFGGGGMLLAFGMVCGLLEAQRSGRGQVVDAAMVDGAALLFGAIFGLHGAGVWTDERGRNLLDSGAPFYEVYETRDEWCAIMDGTDVCFAPVLSIAEAPQHPHAKARGAYVDVDGVTQPAPAPRFSRTPPHAKSASPKRGAHTDGVLGDYGFAPAEITELRAAGVVA